MGAVAQGARDVAGRIDAWVKALLLFLWYAALCAMHVVAVVTLFGSATGPYTFAFAAVIVGAICYFIVPLGGVIFVEGYILHPVWPRLAFVLADAMVAVFLGLTIGFGSSGSLAWPAIGNIVLATMMVLQCFEYIVIGFSARSWFEVPDSDPL